MKVYQLSPFQPAREVTNPKVLATLMQLVVQFSRNMGVNASKKTSLVNVPSGVYTVIDGSKEYDISYFAGRSVMTRIK